MENNQVRIRSAVEGDLQDILAIECASYDYPWSSEQFLQELQNPVSVLDLCCVAGVAAGFLCRWLIAGEMQILNLAIAPQMRRKGIAGQLLQNAFQSAGPQLASVWLEVRAGNIAAISLYQRYGFEPAGMRKTYYRDGEDALLMVRQFQNTVDGRGE